MTTDLCFKCSNKDSILCTICGIAKDGAREHFKQKPNTNADRIRAMTDEELADHFSLWCCRSTTDDSYCKSFGTCDKCWLGWLKEEAKE